MRQIAELYDKISKNIRMESYYFLVAFYGKGLPEYLSNTKFVFRGEKLEMFGNFKERMLNSFCGTKFVESVEDCSKSEMATSESKFIQVGWTSYGGSNCVLLDHTHNAATKSHG